MGTGSISEPTMPTEAGPRSNAPALPRPLADIASSSLFQEARWGMALLGADFTILHVNEALAALVRRRPEEMENVPPDRFTHPDDIARVTEYLLAVRDGRAAAPFVEKRCVIAPAGYMWTETSVSPVRCADGSIAGYLAQLQDVNARREAEMMLHRERRMFIGGPVVVFRWRNAAGWPVEYVSPNLHAEFGWEPGDLLSGTIPYSQLVHADDLARVAREVAQHVAAGADSFERVYRFMHVDGCERSIRDFTVVHRDSAGVATHFEGYIFDDSDRIRAERDLQRRTEEDRSLLQLSRRMLTVNSCEALVDLVRDDLRARIGVNNAWIYLTDPENLDAMRFIAGTGAVADIARRIASEAPIRASPFVLEVMRSETPVLCLEARSDPRTDKDLVAAFGTRSLLAATILRDRQAIRVIWTGTFGDEGELRVDEADIRYFQNVAMLAGLAFQRLRAEEERRQTEERLRQAEKLEAVGQLAGGVAHNFNNALTVVLGHASLMREDLGGDSPYASSLDTILRAGRSSAKMVRQLMHFARPQPSERMERVNPTEVLRDFERMLKVLLDESIRVEMRLQPGLPEVEVEGGAFEMILMNLVLNARDAMSGSGLLSISAGCVEVAREDLAPRSLRRSGLHLRLVVADTGRGMDEVTQARIFEPYFTTKGAEGTGLGLAAVYGAVTTAGGAIEVRSRPGQGSTFTLWVPAAEAAKPAVSAPLRLPRGAGRRVLVVEDHEAVRLFTCRALAARGFEVSTAADAEEALRGLQCDGPGLDLLISDVVMSGMDGVTLARRACELRPGLKVLLMSGYADRMADSDLPLLHKPFTAEKLLGRIAELLDPAPAV